MDERERDAGFWLRLGDRDRATAALDLWGFKWGSTWREREREFFFGVVCLSVDVSPEGS